MSGALTVVPVNGIGEVRPGDDLAAVLAPGLCTDDDHTPDGRPVPWVTDGDVLEIRTQLRYLFIQGQLTSLDNKHLQLYETYRKRPQPSAP